VLERDSGKILVNVLNQSNFIHIDPATWLSLKHMTFPSLERLTTKSGLLNSLATGFFWLHIVPNAE
jgi:hypothetical protein